MHERTRPSGLDRPLLTVVMPTHNRARYATHAVRSILAIDSDELELVVHDTSDDDLLTRAVHDIEDPRLRYTHCTEPLSMTENHNRAISVAGGEYVCLIGDDDSVLPEALAAARWASRNGVVVIAPEVVTSYAWPDFRSRAFGDRHAGRLYMKRRFGGIGIRSGQTALRAALAKAALGTDGLPKVYHGIVARSALERVRERGGTYFYGTSPDVSGAIAVASVIDRYVWIDYPLTIPGTSAGSNSGRSATKTHTGSIEDDPHTRRFRDLEWPDALPRFVSVETVWGHAAHATLKAVAPDGLNEYNMPRLYATCLLRSFGYRRAVMDAARDWQRLSGLSRASLWGRVATECTGVAFRSAWRFAKRASKPSAAGGLLFRDKIKDIAACFEPYRALLKEAESYPSLEQLLTSAEGMLRT